MSSRQAGPNGAILILLDADNDCPAELGIELLRRARLARADRPIRAVLAKTEYEAWFLAATTLDRGEAWRRSEAAPESGIDQGRQGMA